MLRNRKRFEEEHIDGEINNFSTTNSGVGRSHHSLCIGPKRRTPLLSWHNYWGRFGLFGCFFRPVLVISQSIAPSALISLYMSCARFEVSHITTAVVLQPGISSRIGIV